ncbi:ABC transporter permease [Actinocrispum sp. NPDC049592]|uniref:ABC transporter permease n=1 Tax=Actinocrispum sp. NPDC049592 TaxID=3154835 RepID=UPI003440C847
MRWTLVDGWTITRRTLIHWVREPAPVIFGLLFPILIALMFAYLLGGAMTVPGGGDYREFLIPGMFGMNMLFGLSATMIAVRTDAERGVTDRFRSMPMAGPAVLLGRSVADMLNSLLMLAGLIVAGLAMGWRPHNSLGETVLAFLLLVLLRFALVWLGIYLGLVATSPAATTALQTLEFPVGFLSNLFVAPSTMPSWLGTISEWNPLSSTVAATRELFGTPGMGGESWIAQHAVPMAFAWPLLLLAVFFPLAVRRYRRLSR